MTPGQIALALVVINNRVIEAIVAPIKDRYPDLDLWFMMYVSWATGAALSVLAGLNLLDTVFANPLVGLVLTAIVVGGGSNLVADVVNAFTGVASALKDRIESPLG